MQDEKSTFATAVIDAPASPRLKLRSSAPVQTCEGCPAHCCRYVAVEIDKPRAHWQNDQIRWMLLHENVAVYVGNDRHWYVEFRTRCRALQDDGRCGTYETRPDLCRDYEISTCPRWATGSPHLVRFESARAFEDFLALPPARRPTARKASPRRPRPSPTRARSAAAGPKPGRSPRR
jgi:Fe-S-cluster containining protein